MWDAEAVKLSPRREVWPGGLPSPPPAWHGNFGFCSCPSVNGSWPRPLRWLIFNQYKSPSHSFPFLDFPVCTGGRYLLARQRVGFSLATIPHSLSILPSLSASWALLPVHLAATPPASLPSPLLHSSPPRPRGGRPKPLLSSSLACLSPNPFPNFLLILPTVSGRSSVHWPPWAHPALRGLSGLGQAGLDQWRPEAGQGRSQRPGSRVPGGRAGNGDATRSCVTWGARAHPYGRGWGWGREYKTRGGARAAAERVKLWPGAEWALYGDTGPGTLGRAPGCVEKWAGSPDPVLATPSQKGRIPEAPVLRSLLPAASACSLPGQLVAADPSLPPPRLPFSAQRPGLWWKQPVSI